MPQGASLEANRQQKVNGRYYTPEAVARPLVAWALDGSMGRVLDPSFGGCAFLNGAFRELTARSAPRPQRLVWGVDTDPAARRHLQPLLEAGASPAQFLTQDFFSVMPEDLGGRFDALVGNPPYVRHHDLSTERRAVALAAAEACNVPLSGMSNYWAYFAAHALRFLSPGGRLAFVLPGSFFHADYAKCLHESLRNSFESVVAIAVGERIFGEAEETTAVLLASGFGGSCDALRIGWAPSANALTGICEDPKRHTQPVARDQKDGGWLRPLLGGTTIELYDGLQVSEHTARLGEHARIHIGTVTGANGFFTLSPREQRRHRISRRWLRPIVTSSRYLAGIVYTETDQGELAEAGRKCFLLHTSGKDGSPRGLEQYLKQGEDAGVSTRFKCRQREKWHQIPDVEPPDAFLQYMCGGHPRIVLNEARASCTNSLHRITWRAESSGIDPRWFALAMLTSLTRLSAELIGRKYGGGLLKLEPGDARRLLLPVLPKDEKCAAFEEADHLLRDGDEEGARSLADSALLAAHLRLTSQQIGSLLVACSLLRDLRVGNGGKVTR